MPSERASSPFVVTEEDNNSPSSRRQSLLGVLETILRGNDLPTTVPLAFWAACHLADEDRLDGIVRALQGLQTDAIELQTHLELLIAESRSIVRLWSQVSRSHTGSIASSCISGSTQSSRSRNRTASDRCKVRDGRCILTGIPSDLAEACHIYPNCLRFQDDESTRDFWARLRHFWTEANISEWHRAMFPDGLRCGIDSCENMITLSRDCHAYWNRGIFALKPLTTSADRSRMQLAVFLQETLMDAEGIEGMRNTHILTNLPRSDDLSTFHLTALHQPLRITRYIGDEDVRVRTGDILTLTTQDPQRMPLPSWHLLMMQWRLQRLVRMAAAAEIDEEQDRDPSPPRSESFPTADPNSYCVSEVEQEKCLTEAMSQKGVSGWLERSRHLSWVE